MWRLGVALLCAVATLARAQAPPLPPPIYHGYLILQRTGRGVRNPTTNLGRLSVQHWDFFVSPDSDGIFPDREPIEIAFGTQTFTIPTGAMRSRRHGRLFTYRARPLPEIGVHFLRLRRRQPGIYVVSFRVVALDVKPLKFDREFCLPAAVIIGDDDAFSGVKLLESGLEAKVFAVPRRCESDTDWPWLSQVRAASDAAAIQRR